MVTPVSEEVKTRQRTGFNYWAIPGREDPMLYKPETLDECIKRVFKVSEIDIHEKVRKRGKKGGSVYARHLKRYILERLTREGIITDKPRTLGCNDSFKYNMEDIARLCDCTQSCVNHSCATAKNLMQTEKPYKEKADVVLHKIELNLIKFPEL